MLRVAAIDVDDEQRTLAPGDTPVAARARRTDRRDRFRGGGKIEAMVGQRRVRQRLTVRERRGGRGGGPGGVRAGRGYERDECQDRNAHGPLCQRRTLTGGDEVADFVERRHAVERPETRAAHRRRRVGKAQELLSVGQPCTSA